jgi:hypothetical protein
MDYISALLALEDGATQEVAIALLAPERSQRVTNII